MTGKAAKKGTQNLATKGVAPFDDSALLGVYRPAAPIFVGGRGSRLIT